MINVGYIWNECDDIKTTRIYINNACNSNTVYMLLGSSQWMLRVE